MKHCSRLSGAEVQAASHNENKVLFLGLSYSLLRAVVETPSLEGCVHVLLRDML